MRIVLAHSHTNTFGGGERAVLELARGLSSEHDVRLLLGGFEPTRTFADLTGFTARRIGRLRWPVIRVEGDAIVANSFGANLLALRNGARVIYWVHSLRSIFLQPGRLRPDLLARRAIDVLAVRRAARLVANSAYTARQLRRLYRRAADDVVYPGVDLDLYRPASGEPGYAITVGRLSPEKGLERLFDMWRDMPDIPLHVIGQGTREYERELRRLAPTGVVVRGPLAPEHVARAYQQAAVAAFAPFGEEFGIAPLEAMACGVPVVAWRDGGLPETIVNGETGYLVDDAVTFRQRVRLLVRDRALRSTFGAAARRRAEAFSWQRTVAKMEQLCRGLAGAPRG